MHHRRARGGWSAAAVSPHGMSGRGASGRPSAHRGAPERGIRQTCGGAGKEPRHRTVCASPESSAVAREAVLAQGRKLATNSEPLLAGDGGCQAMSRR